MEKRKGSFAIVLYYLFSIVLMIAGVTLMLLNKNFFILSVIVAILGLIIFLYGITSYNKMIKYSNKVNESLSLIDIHLKLRFDLVPNLVNVVKGYAKHEKEVFEEVTKLRAMANESVSEKEKIDLANQALGKIKHIIAVAENYPDLKANTVYKSLMQELVLIEDKIVASRRFYDSNVNAYNTLLEVFPRNIVAKGHGFKRMEMFRIDAGERLNVNLEM